MIINVKADQINVPNTVGAGSSFSEAAVVRLANPSTTDYVVTVSSVNTNAGKIGTFTILANTTEIIEKRPTDVVHVNAGTDVLGVKVGYNIS